MTDKLELTRCSDCIHDGNCALQEISPSDERICCGSAERKTKMREYEVTYRCLHSTIVSAESMEEAVDMVRDNCEYDIDSKICVKDITEEIDRAIFTKRAIESEGFYD